MVLGERKVRGCRLSVGGVFLPKLFYYRFLKLLLKHSTDSEAHSLSPPAQLLVLCVGLEFASCCLSHPNWTCGVEDKA